MTDTVNETAVKVHVASVGADVQLGQAAAPAKQGYRAHYETFVLTANDPVQCILPADPDRLEAYVLALDNDIVIGTKGQVGAPANTVASVPQPIGTYIGQATSSWPVPFPVKDCNAVFAGLTTTANNSRVSVAAYYRD